MRSAIFATLFAMILSCSIRVGQVNAAVSQTFGAGSAVTRIDRQATFDNVVVDQNLNGYAEDQLIISADCLAYLAFDPTWGNGGFTSPFYYANTFPGALISTSDSAILFGVEFNVGTGHFNTTTYVAWEAIKNGISVGSGAFGAASGSVVGFSDPNGFDALHLGAYETLVLAQTANLATDPHAIALDNLLVQLVPEPASVLLFGVGLFGLPLIARRGRSIDPQ